MSCVPIEEGGVSNHLASRQAEAGALIVWAQDNATCEVVRSAWVELYQLLGNTVIGHIRVGDRQTRLFEQPRYLAEIAA